MPFGIPKERPPKIKKKKNNLKTQLQQFRENRLGMFHYQPEAEKKEWAPRLKLVCKIDNQVECKPALLILRFDPVSSRDMFFEQDLMAKPISDKIDKKTGFTYRLQNNRNVIVRKYITILDKVKFIDMAKDFVIECNRILFLYCNTI